MKIVLSAVLAVFLLGCTQEQKDDIKDTANKVEEKVTEVKVPSSEEVIDKVEDIKKNVEATVEEIKNETPDAETIKEKITETTDEIKNSEGADVVKESVAEIVDSVTSPKADGAVVYTACQGCHGTNGERAALGKSKIIKDLSEQELLDSMYGYKDGTYGGPMKGLMKGQVDKLSQDEIEAVSKHISSFK